MAQENLATNRVAETFIVRVNPDDPRWNIIDRGRYLFGCDDLRVQDFPIHGSAAEVTVMYVTFDDHEPTTEEVFNEFKCRGLRGPDRAQTESFLEQYPGEQQKHQIESLCGSVRDRGGRQSVAYVLADRGGIALGWCRLDCRWLHRPRFLAVVPKAA